ncbi:OLC1v1011420C1 [Oldenlandia corymbosa var. corymbosa]|uniref:OLC1v1011420C1 n=1 Tax=Oldenlandia corymbosa var. corymbosa TaxID=529605 RepID=A0AAV1DWX3_OLDCO|nr:OLC1v1011420C1 [Oldenlandia corymbosa var. corymbosa]
MDLDLLLRGFDYTRKQRKWLLLLGGLGFTSYGAYKVYNSPSVAKKRERLAKVLGALFAVAEMVSDSAEAIGVVSKDVKEFLRSDSDQIPNSLKQISKITRSDEMSESLARITTALTVGFLRGNRQESQRGTVGSVSRRCDFSDRVLDKLFTEEGAGFASIIVGSFSRNMILAYCSSKQLNGSPTAAHLVLESNSTPTWADVLAEDKCRELIGNCVQTFVSTAVSVFLDKTMHINTYDQLFSGMTNPKHEAQVKEMLSSICNGAVDTLVRSTHQVMASSGSDTTQKSKFLPTEFGQSPSKDDRVGLIPRRFMPFGSKSGKLSNGNQDDGWMKRMTSTLSIPNNKKFVLDITGRVTFESVRSFLEFLLQKILECMRRSVDIIHEEVVDRGIEVVQHVGRTSSAVVSICLSLCLHILNGPWILVPSSVL